MKAIHRLATAIVLTFALTTPHALPSDMLREEQKQQTVAMLAARQFAKLEAHFEGWQRRYERGEIDDWALLVQYQGFYHVPDDQAARLDAWVKAYPKSYHARLARGIHHRKAGQRARGEAWFDDTPQENIDALHERLDLARADFISSLNLTPRPVVSLVHLMNVTKHREGDEGNRLWLDASLKVDPVSYGARRRYMYTLAPRWGGSLEGMEAFLNECKQANLPPEHLRTYEAIIVLELANAFKGDRHRDEMLVALRRVMTLLKGVDNLEQIGALRGVVEIFRRRDRLHGAAREVEELLRINPADTDMLRYRGAIAEHHGHHDAAWAAYLQAAEGGSASAQYRVGLRLHKGTQPNVDRNEKAGLTWIRLAATKKYEPAIAYLAKIGQ